MDKLKPHIEALIKKAAEATNGIEAMQYSQAALNAAKAMCDLVQAQNMSK
jgi:hypothetical protein